MKKVTTHEEYLVLVQFRSDADDNRWNNAKMWWPGVKNLHDRYCGTEEEAQAVLANAYKVWNGKKHYDAEGKRYTPQDLGGGLGATLVHTKESDHDLEIVRHRIKKRLVTDWELVEGV